METITLKEVKMKIETEVVNKKEYLLVITIQGWTKFIMFHLM
ncbi:hypothetical protein [Melissococcus plutonius]|uniref:Uncharacterized protein n=1 Tax=Melissococcus plutonius TaxID=33970 RepID=A0A2Z5Y4D9_9ENTE|nr:hypothetical protein MPD5_1727 [Melissococcus plutonius DAT561]BBC61772.1 hypothetical protein DAT561_p1070 [Melissococcus plutonius]